VPARKRKARSPGILARMLSGLDVRQLAILLGAVLGSGGLLKLDAARTTQATDDRATATAALGANVGEQVECLTERVFVLERKLRRVEGRRLRGSGDAPLAVVESDSAMAPPPEPEINGGQDAADPVADAAAGAGR
jgi:hypothetical protein